MCQMVKPVEVASHGPYEHFSTDEKAKTGKKAAEIGVAAIVK